MTHEQSQSPSAFRVDQEQGGDRGQNLDSSEAQRCIQGFDLGIADVFENGGTVE